MAARVQQQQPPKDAKWVAGVAQAQTEPMDFSRYVLFYLCCWMGVEHYAHFAGIVVRGIMLGG